MEKVELLEITGYRVRINNNGRKQSQKEFKYKCFCGKEFITTLYPSQFTSCGCLRIQALKKAIVTHGMADKNPLYAVWLAMRDRCNREKNPQYKNYGGRGIKVCPEWQKSFAQFYIDIGEKPGPEYSIDRIDNNKGYCKENCRWATHIEQHNNTRNTILINYNNVTKTISQWAEETKLPRKVIYWRLKNEWDIKDILTIPFIEQNNKRKGKQIRYGKKN